MGDDGKKENTKTDATQPDHNSPYYLHLSDYPRQMHVNDALTDGNYLDWVQEMENFLFAKNKIGFLDGTIKRPEADDQGMAHNSHRERDLRKCKAISNTKQEGMTVSAYYIKLRGLWDEMKSFLPIPICKCKGCTCDIGKSLRELKEKEQLYEFLMGLDGEFSIIRTQILATKPIASLGNAYHLVAEDEKQRAIVGGRKPMNETMAFQASMKRGGPSNRRSQKEEKSATQCGECGRDGHTRDGCFKIIGYPEWWNVKNKREKARPKAACAEAEPNKIANLTKEQYEQFRKLFAAEDKPVQSEPPRTANMAGKFKHNDEWIMDSGCTEHITYRSDALENITESKNEPPVTIPNGENVPVEGRGIHTLPNGATVQDVLHVPKFTFNLLSGLRTRKLIGAGRCKDGLYQMGMLGTRRRAMIGLGCLAYYRSIEMNGDKFEIRGRPGIFMGYPSGTKGYKIYDPSNGKIITSRDVRFAEKVFLFDTKFKQDRHEMEDVFATFMDEENRTVEPNMTVAENHAPTASDQGSSTVCPIANFVSYEKFSKSHKAFLIAITKNDEPKSFKLAVQDHHWKDAMQKEIKALEDNRTWTIEELPNGKRAIDSKWVYKTKFKPNGEVEMYKARLVAKGYTQMEGIDYHDTFAPASRNWYQKFTSTLLQLNYKQSAADHSLFIYNKGKVFVTTLIYVDDIIMAGNDEDQLKETNKFLNEKFSIKDLGDSGLLGCSRPCTFPMEPNIKLDKGEDDVRVDASKYKRLVGRLLYLQATRPNLAYSEGGTDLVSYCDADWIGYSLTRQLRTGYVLLLGGAPMSWKSKKQSIVSRSSAEAKYRVMANATSEILWMH
ncbi:putative RNA-directed DNA polymerase [Tanacetum coccineum]